MLTIYVRVCWHVCVLCVSALLHVRGHVHWQERLCVAVCVSMCMSAGMCVGVCVRGCVGACACVYVCVHVTSVRMRIHGPMRNMHMRVCICMCMCE